MKAMVLRQLGSVAEHPKPLRYESVADPEPKVGELLIQVAVCGVCHTELDEIEGRTPPAALPAILGHEVVGHVVDRGAGSSGFEVGDRVGVAWIHSTCGSCSWCLAGAENLCQEFHATGRDAPGGYAEYMTVPAPFAHRIPRVLEDARAAPLLCAGAIGDRALRLTGLQNGDALGLTGFGASGHLVLQLAGHRFPDSHVYVFARSAAERELALELGAAWAGDTEARPPSRPRAIIDSTPAWRPVVAALAALAPGGRLVINAIRKTRTDQAELLKLDYARHLWLEKEIKSVANVTRHDVRAFLSTAAEFGIQPEVQEFDLAQANYALSQLEAGVIRGAKVLRVR